MSKEGEGLLRMLEELLGKSFICLRCGSCCFNYEVRLPDGKIKPGSSQCPYLIPRHKEGNRWVEATCTIHDRPEYPEECKMLAFGPGPCPIGLSVWKKIKEKDPAELPEEVKKYI